MLWIFFSENSGDATNIAEQTLAFNFVVLGFFRQFNCKGTNSLSRLLLNFVFFYSDFPKQATSIFKIKLNPLICF